MKDIPGFGGKYAATPEGKILRKKGYRARESRLLNGWINRCGYRVLKIDRKNYTVHRLIAATFLKRKNVNETVNHKNGTKTDNRVENLEWCSLKENIQHAFRTGLMPRKNRIGVRASGVKLNENEVREIRSLVLDGFSMRTVAKFYSTSHSTISAIINKKRWVHI